MLFLAVILLLLSTTPVIKSQDNCECIAYFYCFGNSTDSDKCTGEFDTCCYPDPSLSGGSTQAPFDPFSAVVEPAETDYGPSQPAEDGVCGVRGSLSKVSAPPSLPPSNPDLGSEEALPHLPPPSSAPTSPDLGSVVDYKVVAANGEDTSTVQGEFPWMVAVMKVDSSGQQEFLCGGSIIYPNVILTAAHSVREYSASNLVVKAGVWDTVDQLEIKNHQDRYVADIVLHPEFDQQKVKNDLAILVLRNPFTITDNIATVCLPSSQLAVNTTSCVATGWGTSNFGKQSNMSSVLKKVDLPLIDYNTCQNRLRKVPKLGTNFNLHDSFICAGGDKVDTCKGDGGGPLMCATLDDPNRYVQVGVTSWGVGCAQGPPGVYASVQAAADWIDTTYTTFTITESIKKNERIKH